MKKAGTFITTDGLSHPVTKGKRLVVFHSLKNVTKNVVINGKGVV